MQNRTNLRSFFLNNSIPTEKEFQALIDSQLNQEDDGIRKMPNGPIALKAQGRELLHFYNDFSKDDAPSWRISQAGTDPGLSIGNGSAESLLFIKADDGNVGIGTSAPATKLDVRGAARISAALTISEGNVSVPNGNVGIGIAPNPEYRLDVSGKVRLGGFTTADSDEDYVSWLRDQGREWDECLVKTTAANDRFSGRKGFGIHMHATRRFSFYSTDWNQLMSIEGGTGNTFVKGRLNIGHTAAGLPLDVRGSIGLRGDAPSSHLYFSHTGDSAYINAGGSPKGLHLAVGTGVAGSYGDPSQNYKTGISVLPSGFVGIGSTTPQSRLQIGTNLLPINNYVYDANTVSIIHDTKTSATAINDPKTVLLLGRHGTDNQSWAAGAAFKLSRFENSGVASRTQLDITMANSDFDIDSNTVMTLRSNGRVGIGTKSPGTTLDVQGDIGLRRASAWDHLWMSHDGSAAYIAAGGAEKGLFLQVGKGASGTYGDGGQKYTTGICIRDTGYVGIGNGDPKFPLHVTGSAASNSSDYYAYFVWRSDPAPKGKAMTDVYAELGAPIGIKADSRIAATEFMSYSDVRAKDDIVASDPAADLDLLNQIRIRDFRYRDASKMGGMLQKGVLAQEIEQILPESVTVLPDVIPDILAFPDHAELEEQALRLTMKEDHGLSSGDFVRLVTETSALEAQVRVIDSKSFSVPDWEQESTAVFVYGKRVPDFRTVNYNSLFSLGLSAMQELSREVRQLKSDLSDMRRQLAATPALS